jgi:hypothetical protein
MVADHRGAFAALGPVAAGAVLGAREGGAVRLRAGEDVVHVGRVAAAVDRLALLAQGGLPVDPVVLAVQVSEVARDHLAPGVLPRAAADAVAGVDGGAAVRCAGAEIGAPGPVAGAGRLGERLAMRVGAGDPAEIGALAGVRAGDEEGHRLRPAGLLLGLCPAAVAEQQERRRRRGQQGRPHRVRHADSSFAFVPAGDHWAIGRRGQRAAAFSRSGRGGISPRWSA